MFGRNLKLFTAFGFDVRVNVSWAFLAILVALSLARGFFPAVYAGWPEATYWWMAAAGVVGVFFSIVVHELSHSLAARAFGMKMTGITLFLFGGVAEMEREPPSPKAEFFMAIAGPAISLALAVLFIWIAAIAQTPDDPSPALAVIEYLGLLNFVLAAFNLIPAFPMDGGRALRAALWAGRGDMRWATKWASRIGAAFGLFLIFAGLLVALSGAFVQGLWWFLIGMFVRGAALGSYHQMEVSRLMRGVTAADLMETARIASPEMSLADLVENYVYEFQEAAFPVCDHDQMIGVVSVAEIKKVSRDQWATTRVGDVMQSIEDADLVDPSEDAIEAVKTLQRNGGRGLIVARNKKPLGVLSQADVMKLLNLKLDLETA